MQHEDSLAEETRNGPGATLRGARERAGLSVEEVADRLNLLVSHLEALENDDYTQFTGEIFIRGYIRSYARLLDLAEGPLLAALDERRAPRGGSRAADQERSPRHPLLRFAVALLAAIVIWALAVHLLHEPEPADEPAELPPPTGSIMESQPNLAQLRPDHL